MDDPHQQVILPDDKVLPDWIKLPCLVGTYMIWLSDCESVENGPTHIVPGSHRFGKKVDPVYAEANCIKACGKAGTAVFVNSQTWHRGASNTSDKPRDTLQLTFGRRIIGHKFRSIMDYKMPSYVVEGMDDKKKKRFGYLQGGAYS
jgi:ectoine hydroxylase-related dioxygenase (phytanoyl-CoA dioxygenase family)